MTKNNGLPRQSAEPGPNSNSVINQFNSMVKRKVEDEAAESNEAGHASEQKAPSTPALSKKSKRTTSGESPSSVTDGVLSLTIKRKTDESYHQRKYKAPYGGSKLANDESPPSTPPPSIANLPSSGGSTRSASSLSRSVKKLTLSKHDERSRLYLQSIIRLNEEMYNCVQRLSEEEVPSDGTFTMLAGQYVESASRITQKYRKTYGDVAVFGDGDCGQLGCGQGVSAARNPRIVAGLRGMEIGAVAAGGLHTLVLTENGTVYSFGCNDEGALGGEIVDDGYQPCLVDGFVPSAFGPNGDGAIMPFEARKEKLGEATIVQIVAGETTSLALSEEGDVYMWGSYRDSEGRKFRHLPPKDDDRTPTGRKDMATLEEDEPKEWYIPPRGNQDWPLHICLEMKALDISAGDGWAAAILQDGTVRTWGIGTHGEMGREVAHLDKTTSNEVIIDEFLTPKPPMWSGGLNEERVVGISCGAYHLLVLTRHDEGTSVYGCGLNQYGQLGLGDKEPRFELTKIEYLEGRSITKVEAGYHFSCFVNNTGKELYACGRSDYGQLGISLEQPDSGSMETTPVRVPLVYDIDSSAVSDPKGNCIDESKIIEEDQPEIEQISCGSTQHVLVLTKEGDTYSWGFGESGACGQGKCDSDVLRPKKLIIKGGRHDLKFVSGGGQHSAAVVVTKSRDSHVG